MGSSKKKKQVVGYWYGATAHFGIGLAMDELYKIKIGNTHAWAGSIKKNSSIYINAPNIFGGEKKEGGLQGTLDVMFGKNDQARNGRLTSILGSAISAFRGSVTTVFDGWFCANNPYPKPWEFYYRRITSGWPDNIPWYPQKITISLANGQIQAMNPAHMLYESYISDTWGSGEPRGTMDNAAWQAAADTLYDEKFGLCLEWKATDDLKNFRDLVCSHIGAKLSTNPSNGLITIKLIRDDYKLESLPIFDEDHGLLSLSQDNTNNTEVPSQLIVKYIDAITFEEQSAHATNPAIAQAQGGRSVETIDYQAIPTGELATRVAYRDLKIKTTALKRFTFKLDRRGADLVIGQPFRVRTLRRKNNFDVVVRAERIEERFLTDGTINVTALQDVFGLPKIAINPTPIIPEVETSKPVPVVERVFIEAPYRELVGLIDDANLQLLDQNSSYFFVLAINPADACQSFNLYSKPRNTANFNQANDTGIWCPTATLANDISYLDKIIVLEAAFMLEDVEVGSAAMLDNEIVRVDKVDLTKNTITIGRGCIDTVPAKHKAGARIWFYDGYETTDGKEYTTGIVVETKLTTNTSTQQLELSKAPTDSMTMQGRQARPYISGNLKINGIAYPEKITGNTVTINWSHRDRLLQADQLIDTTISNISLEQNTSYNLSVHFNDQLIERVNTTANNHKLNLNLKNGDVALLHLDNPTDESGKTWITKGSACFDTVNPILGSASLSLDGTGSWIETIGSEDFVFGKNDFTIEARAKLEGTNKIQVIIDHLYTGYNTWQIMVAADGRAVFHSYQSKSIYLYGTSNIADGKAHHIAVTRANGITKIFIDGVLEATSSVIYDYSYKAPILAIGAQVAKRVASYDFTGHIDEVRISKGIARFTENFTPPIKSYSFEEKVPLTGMLKVELEAIRDNLTSYQKHTYECAQYIP